MTRFLDEVFVNHHSLPSTRGGSIELHQHLFVDPPPFHLRCNSVTKYCKNCGKEKLVNKYFYCDNTCRYARMARMQTLPVDVEFGEWGKLKRFCKTTKPFTYDRRRYRIHAGYYKTLITRNVMRSLHRIIWTQINGEIPGKHIIHHKDHNALNNHPDNLELIKWGKHTTVHLNTRSEQEDLLIISRYKMGKTTVQLSTEFNRGLRFIYNILDEHGLDRPRRK